MAAETDDDRAAFFDTDDFGEEATYTPDGGEASTVDVILDRRTVQALDGFGGGVHMRETVATLRESDLPSGAANGDAFTVRSIDFIVEAIEPDGTGLVKLILRRAT